MADVQEMKEQAMAYYAENKVPLRMQDVLNTMFKVSPQDVNGFVSTYFEGLALNPTVTRALAVRAMDSKGQPAITVKVYCLVRNKEVMLGESQVSWDTSLLENARSEDKDAEDQIREQEIEEAITLVNNDFRELLESANPRHQTEIDEKIYQLIETRRLELLPKPDENREVEVSTPQPPPDEKKGAKKSAKGSAGKGKGKAATVRIPFPPKHVCHPRCLNLSWLHLILYCSICVTPIDPCLNYYIIRSYDIIYSTTKKIVCRSCN